ncbi:MAG TPA: FAD-binding oxidoreductase [Jatrophihabitantaceae bacterium]|jgi:FAD/FMN-containing dehydrogenase
MSLPQTDLAVETLRRGDDGYDAAARVFFTTGDPALVVRPRCPEEITAALAHAAGHGLAVSVRSGGHSPVGHSTNTGGMVIDLAHLDDVEVLDVGRRLVRVGGGATWGQVAAALDPHGWAITAGDTTSVGVGGLTLGGGVGWMVRRHGLAIDNLVGARVVTADGRLLTTSQDEHPDLFWALRGGGGNFGVVIDFYFVAQPVGTVHFGSVAYQLDDPAELLGGWRDAMRLAPEDLSSTLVLTPRRPGTPPSATVLVCYAGEPRTAVADVDATIEPLVELGTVSEAFISERRYSEILEDAAHPPGLRLVVRNILVPALDDAVIAAIGRLYAAPGPTAIAVRSLGGAFSRVPADATAFAHRDAEAMVVCMRMLPHTATDAEVEQALDPWRAVAAHGSGTYVNFQGSATAADLAAAYPPATYARLAAVKRAYDPGNRFAYNHNIKPAQVERA